jgi:GNAT superfamily N-acetyltransferase
MSAVAALAIRPAVPADAAGLCALMRDTFVAAYGHCTDPRNLALFLARHYSPEIQRAEIEDAHGLTLLAGQGTDWAGFAQLRFDGAAGDGVTLARPVEVGRFYLAPAWHGRGVAAQLMRRAREEAARRGADGLWLNVWQQAPQAIRYYGKEGFRIVGRSVFPVGEDPQQDWVMQWP